MALKIYKRGQGYYTRLYTALIAFVIIATGCFVLHGKLKVYNVIWVETLIPAGICAVLGFLVYWIVNKPNVADFMISAEGEIKKVSWSSRKEIIASTLVVICVVSFMAVMLLVADVVFKSLFMYVIGL
ncbi:MAG: preprotein translocase subunit SecE [Planctomycetes bacterium]|nr:preprotein translocase subunit SecE [Planctomycetota bacterium]